MKHLKPALPFFVIFLLSNCNNQDEQWNKIIVDPNLSQDSVYRRLEREDEIFSILEKDTLMRRTSDVEYLSGNTNYGKYSKMNNCRAFFYKSDTLTINVGISNGFSGSGFFIKYNKNKFFTEPYYFDDDIM